MKLKANRTSLVVVVPLIMTLTGTFYEASEDHKTQIIIKDVESKKISTMEILANKYRVYQNDVDEHNATIQGHVLDDNIQLSLQTKKIVNATPGEIEIPFEDITFEGMPYSNRYISKIEIKLHQSSDVPNSGLFQGIFDSNISDVIVYNSNGNGTDVRLNDKEYSSQSVTSGLDHSISFKTQGNNPLLTTYIRKKKKDTRIDVYLTDTGKKDFTILFRRLGNWLTSMFEANYNKQKNEPPIPR